MKVMEQSQNPAVKEYVLKSLGEIEGKKSQLGNIDAKDHFENFVTQVFVNADTEDRSGQSNKTTAKNFLVCSHFIEVMNVFEELPPDWEEKRKYCKWKANDIAKALKEGRQPTPGPPESMQASRENASFPPPVEPNQVNNFMPGQTQGYPSQPAQTLQGYPSQPAQIPQGYSGTTPGFQPPPVAQQPPPVAHQPPPVAHQPPPQYSGGSSGIPPSRLDRQGRTAVAEAKKLAEYAASELSFGNIAQGREFLHKALEVLNEVP